MNGSATLAMVLSKDCINVARMMTATIRRRRAPVIFGISGGMVRRVCSRG
jgi:hypothetical protein